ncbi:putative WD-40 repeat-containing protein [Diplocarpon rosae]|nr:putative WD-40 repeat-containing protein [Diplocarpon rosae]
MESSGNSTSLPPDTGHSESVTPLGELALHAPPSCLEFLQISSWEQFFVVGTYQLEPDIFEPGLNTDVNIASENPKEQSRNGTLNLISRNIHTVKCDSAIYDLHFLPGQQFFAAVSSTGTISFYEVIEMERDLAESHSGISPSLRIELLFTKQVFSLTTIITYFTFFPPHTLDVHRPLVAATTDDGGVYLMVCDMTAQKIELLNGGEPVHRHVLKEGGAPDFAWCCAVNSNVTTSIYSGGDNAELVRIKLGNNTAGLWDLEEKVRVELYRHTFHDAGVTAILPLPHCKSDDSALLLTGSYDTHIRLYSISHQRVMAQLDLGGGVYRLRLIQEQNWPAHAPRRFAYLILACCMHGGTKVIDVRTVSTDDFVMEVVGSLNVPANDSGNYCYAADVLSPPHTTGSHGKNLSSIRKRMFVSGSFVDRKLTSWLLNH